MLFWIVQRLSKTPTSKSKNQLSINTTPRELGKNKTMPLVIKETANCFESTYLCVRWLKIYKFLKLKTGNLIRVKTSLCGKSSSTQLYSGSNNALISCTFEILHQLNNTTQLFEEHQLNFSPKSQSLIIKAKARGDYIQ